MRIKLIKTFSICLFLFLLNIAHAVEPSREPILKIDTGMHMAPIKRISVDRQERFLVTGSHDETVRLWDIPSGRQYSLEDPGWQNGAFTKALVEGIRGKADYKGKGKITVNMLDLYISERVKELTQGKQTPVTTKPNTVPDFPVAVR